jgi:glycogen synthase
MKVFMTTDTVGGVWTYSLELSRALAPHGVQIVLAAKGIPSREQLAAAKSVPNLTVTVGNFALEWMNNPWQDVAAAGKWLLRLAERARPDIIHLNDYCHAALPWDAPVLVVGHSCVLSWISAVHGVEDDRGWKRYRNEVRRGLQAADVAIAPTAHMLSALEYFYVPLPEKRVIANGCDPSRYQIRAKRPLVFSAGRFWDEAKNIATLAAAAPQLEWPVVVAGLQHPDGPKMETDVVNWLGTLVPEEMAIVYSVASIYALPALYEPFGLTILEAALSGCALVLGDIPSLREVWEDAALYVPPRDVRALTRAINGLIHDPDRRELLAMRAYSRGRRFTAERMASAYFQQYRSLMAAPQHAPLAQGKP